MIDAKNTPAACRALVSLQDVTVLRGPRPIFRDFCVEIKQGAFHAIIGPSGAGKSTLLGLICGVLKANNGHISVVGEDITRASNAARDQLRAAHMGIVFQNLGLASPLSVLGNLQLACRMAGQGPDDAFARDLLHRLGLEARSHAKPRQLSRGEAQRAAIARALIVRPALFIADEPTASLDERWRDRVMDLIFAEAAQTDMTMILSTHDPQIARRFDDLTTLPQDIAR